MTARSPTQLIAQPFLQLNLCVKDKFAVSQSTLAPREKRGRMVEWVKVCTYDQHRRSHHLGDTLPEFSSGAWFTQTSCKFPGLRVRWGGHRYAPFRISDPSNPGATIIDIQRKSILGLSRSIPTPPTTSAHHEFEVGSCWCGVPAHWFSFPQNKTLKFSYRSALPSSGAGFHWTSRTSERRICSLLCRTPPLRCKGLPTAGWERWCQSWTLDGRQQQARVCVSRSMFSSSRKKGKIPKSCLYSIIQYFCCRKIPAALKGIRLT